MIVTSQQKKIAFELSGIGRGGLLLDRYQRSVLVEVAARHYDSAYKTGKPFSRPQIVERTKTDPQVKGVLPFLILALLGAVIGWIINKLLDAWWDDRQAEGRVDRRQKPSGKRKRR